MKGKLENKETKNGWPKLYKIERFVLKCGRLQMD